MATNLMSRMGKKAASSSATLLANRTPHRNYTSSIFITPLKTISNTGSSTSNLFRTTSVPTHHHFSAQAEKTHKPLDHLFGAIKSQFEEVLKPSENFHFKIEDNAWHSDNMTMTREYQGEEIKVKVYEPLHHSRYPNGYVNVTVNVSENGQPTLEFHVIAEPTNKLTLRYLNVKKPYSCKMESPTFEISDAKLHKPFLEYLEARGIEPSIGKFLYHWKYINWLKNII